MLFRHINQTCYSIKRKEVMERAPVQSGVAINGRV